MRPFPSSPPPRILSLDADPESENRHESTHPLPLLDRLLPALLLECPPSRRGPAEARRRDDRQVPRRRNREDQPARLRRGEDVGGMAGPPAAAEAGILR